MVKKKFRGGGGGGEGCRQKKFSFHFAFYAIFNIKQKYWKVPLHLLVKWEVVSPNSRFFMLEIAWNAMKTFFFFFQYLKKIHKKFKQHSINTFLSYSAKTKRNGRTDGRGALQYLPSRAFSAAGDNNIHVYTFIFWEGPSMIKYPLFLLAANLSVYMNTPM